MIEKKNIFKFQQFEIEQSENVWKIGTDGVLLAAITDPVNSKRILDIGTGCGLISLMLAQKTTAIIDAIDINPDAVELAKKNVLKSKWKDKINIFHSSLQDFDNNTKYDLIITNPPYFTNGEASPIKSRAIARHNLELKMDILAEKANELLSDDGLLVLIYPNIEMEKFIQLAETKKLSIRKKIFVIPKIGYDSKRIIGFFAKSPNFKIDIQNITIEKENRHDYTDEFIKLTKDYYYRENKH